MLPLPQVIAVPLSILFVKVHVKYVLHYYYYIIIIIISCSVQQYQRRENK
jgi:hypothetical protein